LIDTMTWTEEMRKKAAEALRMIRAEEEESFEVLTQMI